MMVQCTALLCTRLWGLLMCCPGVREYKQPPLTPPLLVTSCLRHMHHHRRRARRFLKTAEAGCTYEASLPPSSAQNPKRSTGSSLVRPSACPSLPHTHARYHSASPQFVLLPSRRRGEPSSRGAYAEQGVDALALHLHAPHRAEHARGRRGGAGGRRTWSRALPRQQRRKQREASSDSRLQAPSRRSRGCAGSVALLRAVLVSALERAPAHPDFAHPSLLQVLSA
jgi:hypothetical protein